MTEELAQLRSKLQLARKACQEIGQAPPRPAGLRAAIGSIPLALMQRLMFWYAPAVQRAIGALTDAVDDAVRDLSRMIQQDSGRITTLEGRLQEVQEAALQAEGRWQDAIRQERQAAERQLQEFVHLEQVRGERQLREVVEQERMQAGLQFQAMQSQIALLEARLNEQTRALELERATTIGLEGDLREQAETLQQIEEDRRQKDEALELRLQDSTERLQLLRRETIENGQRLVRLLDEARRKLPALDDAQLRALAQEDLEGIDALAAALECSIRGTRGEAQERWKAYLPLMPRDGPVLDLGCGRGEWLELLRAEGIAARGADWNPLMVAECRERQLEAEPSEALDYLARTPDESLAAVTVFRLVEHLPFRKLVRLLDEVARVLRPGGTAIFETPNPDNLLVAGRDFYRDPARRRPIPSDTLRLLVESRGLVLVDVLFLNPAGEVISEDDDGAVARRLNRHFYGPRDYAVVSRKAI